MRYRDIWDISEFNWVRKKGKKEEASHRHLVELVLTCNRTNKEVYIYIYTYISPDG